MAETKIRGCRVLLIEDEVMIAMHVSDVLDQLGHLVVAIGTNLKQGLELARSSEFDFAVLDINLGGEMSFPVADILRQRRIPFFFLSGYTSAGIDDGYRHEIRVCKPFRASDLAQSIGKIGASP
jgi:DNA-binding response OmpR family regulator